MKRLAALSTCLLAIALAPVALAEPASYEPGSITTEALAALLRSGAPVVLLDARPTMPATLPGAKQLVPEASAEALAAAAPDKDALIITYCSAPACKLSHRLATRLAKLGYANVIEYTEGFSAWRKAGHPTVPFI